MVKRWLPIFTYIANRAITEYGLTVVNATIHKTVVSIGYMAQASFEVINRGVFDRTFNVTVYANTTIVLSQTVTLAGKGYATVTLKWSTAGFSVGNYLITANIMLTSEGAKWSTVFHVGFVKLTISGDVDGDFDVDIYDIVNVCAAYGSGTGGPRYVTNYDINCDGKVDIYDVVIACANYGKRYP